MKKDNNTISRNSFVIGLNNIINQSAEVVGSFAVFQYPESAMSIAASGVSLLTALGFIIQMIMKRRKQNTKIVQEQEQYPLKIG